jgi:uncharacterized membrane protein YGL010W
MKKNMGNLDRGIRMVIAITLAVLFFTGKIEGTLGYVAIVVAAIFALTSVISFCPIYAIFGIKTCPLKDK